MWFKLLGWWCCNHERQRLITQGGTVALLIALVLTASVDQVLLVRFGKQMQLYSLPLTEMLYPLAFCLLAWLLFALWRCRTSAQAYNRIPPLKDMWQKYLIIAGLDELSGSLMLFPMLYLHSEIQLAFGQLQLLVLLGMSYFYLRTRYVRTHYLGVAAVLTGVAVVLLPAINDYYRVAPTSATDDIDPSVNTVKGLFYIWLGLQALSFLPTGFSKVFQENILKLWRHDLPVFYMMAWVSLFQIGFSFITLPFTLFLPLPAPALVLPTEEFFPFLKDALVCFLGQEPSIANSSLIRYEAAIVADCSGDWPPWLLFSIYLGFNILFNIEYLLLLRLTSANLSTVVGVSRLGIVAFLYSWPWLAGAAYRALEQHEVLGLFVIAVGIAVYGSHTPELQEPPEDDEEIALHDLGSDSTVHISLKHISLKEEDTEDSWEDPEDDQKDILQEVPLG